MKPKVDARLAALETAQAAAEGPLRIAFHVLVVDRDPVTGELVTTDPETGDVLSDADLAERMVISLRDRCGLTDTDDENERGN